MFTSLHADRLLRLADFIEAIPPCHEVLEGRHFDFNVIRKEQQVKPLDGGPPSCGTVACAMGWMPEAFPEMDIEVMGGYVYRRASGPGVHVSAFAKDFFQIDASESAFLFYPNQFGEQVGEELYPGVRRLDVHASGKEVADNIRNFVTYKLSNLKLTTIHEKEAN